MIEQDNTYRSTIIVIHYTSTHIYDGRKRRRRRDRGGGVKIRKDRGGGVTIRRDRGGGMSSTSNMSTNQSGQASYQ